MAVYKHSGFSDGQKHFEWFSENPDPLATNPYQDGRYPNLTFQSVEATPIQASEHLSIQAEIVKSARLKTLKAKYSAIKGSDLNTLAEIKQAILDIHEMLGIK